MPTNRIFKVLVFALLPFLLLAQRLPKPDALTIEDGLGFRDVTALTQDSRGLLWIGTSQGIERYDGLHFVKYGGDRQADFPFPAEGIPDEGLINFNDSTIWAIANGQLYAFDLCTNTSKNLSSLAGLGGNISAMRQAKNGAIWLVADAEAQQILYKYEENLHFRPIAASARLRTPFNSVACDPKGNIWWSTNAEGLRLFSPEGELLHAVKLDSFTWYGTEMYFTPVFADSRNRVFIMPKSVNQIWQYHPENGGYDIIADHLPSPAYYNLEDSQGNIWFALRNGLLRWRDDPEYGSTLTDFSGPMRNSLHFTDINDLFEDRTHILWVATDNGLLRFPIGQQFFQNYLTMPGVAWNNSMRGIFQTNSGVVYAFCDKGESGLYRLNMGTGETILEFPIDAASNATLLEQSAKHFIYDQKENTAWALTDRLLRIDLNNGRCSVAGEFEGITQKFDHNPFLRLQDGSFLLGSQLDNLTIFDPKTMVRTRLLPNGLSGLRSANTEVFLEDANGSIWVGTASGGLYCFNRKGEILAHFTTKTEPALSKDHVLALHFDNTENLWIGTFGGGLNCLELPRDWMSSARSPNLKIRVLTQKEGLCDNNVVSILEDDSGNIWAATYNGLSCYRTSEGAFRNFYEEDGLSNNEFNYASSLKDGQGNLWFGGMNGLSVFAPKDILQAEKNPRLCLTGFIKYDQRSGNTETQTIGHQTIERFIISPYDSWFQFSWSLPNYFKPSKNHYYVRLQGLENDWSYLGSTPFVRYNKLPPGKYVLHVKGSDSKGNWSESELAVAITVHPFFYQTWWFYLLILGLFGGAVYRISRFRHFRLLEMERMRTRIASDLHDEVGSMLAGLAMQAELLEMKADEKERSHLQHIAHISHTAVSKMRDLVWSIDSRRDMVKNLLDRMREQTAEVLQPHDLAWTFVLGDLPLDKKLPVDVRQHLFLFFKEALTNVLRHSNATDVTVRFGNFDGHFELSIHDNGVSPGPPDKIVTGLGLSNMQMRAEKLDAKWAVQQSEGFTVRLHMKAL